MSSSEFRLVPVNDWHMVAPPNKTNPEAAGPFLYAIRYKKDVLMAKQQQVIDSLFWQGARSETDESGAVRIVSEPDDNPYAATIDALAQELAIVNGALEYASDGIEPCSIGDFARGMKSRVATVLGMGNAAVAQDLLRTGIPSLVEAIYSADALNGVIEHDDDRRALNDLATHATVANSVFFEQGFVQVTQSPELPG